MGGLDNIFAALTHPLAKWVALAFALRALWSLVSWRMCPVASGREDVAKYNGFGAKRQALWRHSWRFFIIMIAGIALSVTGLFKLATYGGDAPLGLFLLVLGIYLFTTEPVRMQILDAEDRIVDILRGGGDREARSFGQAILRSNHANLVFIEIGAALMLALAVAALNSGIKMPM